MGPVSPTVLEGVARCALRVSSTCTFSVTDRKRSESPSAALADENILLRPIMPSFCSGSKRNLNTLKVICMPLLTFARNGSDFAKRPSSDLTLLPTATTPQRRPVEVGLRL